VDHLAGDAVALKKVGQSEQVNRKGRAPQKPIEGPIIIGQFGNVEKETIKLSHWALIVKWAMASFQPLSATR